MPVNNVILGKNVKIPHPELVNLYGCRIGDNCMVGPFCEIQSDVEIGEGTLIESHSFICSKVRIGKNSFIGHGVMFINDRHPVHREAKDWQEVVLEDNVIIGSNATIFPCRIGKGAVIGAGSVVLNDVEKYKTVAGNPAKMIR